MALKIVHEVEPYRMVTDGRGHFAVLEARNGRVYTLHCHDRREAPDTPDGMEAAVAGCWCEHEEAARRLLFMARSEKHYSETIW